jgi:hypothetical protein
VQAQRSPGGEYNPEVSTVPAPRHRFIALALAAAACGIVVARHYAALDLSLSHYDARGHLVVARRIFDSITPGWQQIGAVWLPLPHLLNALPVQVDAWYRSGASAIAISVLSYGVAVSAIAWIVQRVTRSAAAAAVGTLAFALNPNVLYLQSTPMTEPLLIGLTVGSIALLMQHVDRLTAAFGVERDMPRVAVGAALDVDVVRHRSPISSPARLGVGFALACLTRYEAWPIAIGALAAAIWVLWRSGVPTRRAASSIWQVAVYPLAAIAAFTIFSRVVIGSWFADDFFVPENRAEGHPYAAVAEILWGVRELSGPVILAIAIIGAVLLTVTALVSRRQADRILPLALLGSASVPWSAFMDGHPFRIRYSVPLLAVEAICVGVAAGAWRWGLRALVTAVVLVGVVSELRPLASNAPMVLEAQWDRPNFAPRGAVTAYLAANYHGESIMASMGSLGHYMQDLSRAGFSIRDFLHEGNGDIWLAALGEPRPYAGWILIEEKAEGGDMLARREKDNPRFLEGYTRVAEGAGLALYRRQD